MSSITPESVRQKIDEVEAAICSAWEAGTLVQVYKQQKPTLKWLFEQRELHHSPAVKAEFDKQVFLWRFLVMHRQFKDGILTALEFNSAVSVGMRSTGIAGKVREGEVANATGQRPTADPAAKRPIDPSADKTIIIRLPPKSAIRPTAGASKQDVEVSIPARSPARPKAGKRVRLPSKDEEEAMNVDEAPKVRQRAKRVTKPRQMGEETDVETGNETEGGRGRGRAKRVSRPTGKGEDTDVETGYDTEGGRGRGAVVGTGIFNDPKCGRCENKGLACEVRGTKRRQAGNTCTACAQLKVRCTLAPERGADAPKRTTGARKSRAVKKKAVVKAEDDEEMADAQLLSTAEGKRKEQAPDDGSMTESRPTGLKTAEGKGKGKAQERGPSAEAGPSSYAGAIAAAPNARHIADGTTVGNVGKTATTADGIGCYINTMTAVGTSRTPVGNITGSPPPGVMALLIQSVLLLEKKVAELEKREANVQNGAEEMENLVSRVTLAEEQIQTVGTMVEDLGEIMNRQAGRTIPAVGLIPPTPHSSQEAATYAHVELIAGAPPQSPSPPPVITAVRADTRPVNVDNDVPMEIPLPVMTPAMRWPPALEISNTPASAVDNHVEAATLEPTLLPVDTPAIRRSPRLSPLPEPLPLTAIRRSPRLSPAPEPLPRMIDPAPSSKRAGSYLEEESAMKRSRHE